MTKRTLNGYLLELAQERLKNRPGQYERLRAELEAGSAVERELRMLIQPMERGYVTAMDKWHTLDERLLKVIDEWSTGQTEARGVDALPAIHGNDAVTPETAPTPPVVTEGASGATAWTVNKPERYRGYSVPLHRLLAAAHREGKPRPSARDVIEELRVNRPAEIAQVLPDSFDYYDSEGNTKSANMRAVTKAIGRMTRGR